MSDEEWIKASDAFTALTANGENPNEIVQSLATYLRFGKLNARAKQIWTSEETTLEKAWKSRPIALEPDTAEKVPVGHWRSDKNWLEDVSLWRWPVSKFHITLRKKPTKRRMIHGVSFSLLDLAKIFPQQFGSGKRKGKRGPDPDLAKRDRVWLELLQMALDKKLTKPDKEFDGQTELELIIHLKLNPEGGPGMVGHNLIGQIVRQAYHKLR